MCSYSCCQVYDDITSTIHIANDVLFLRINDEKDNSEISITLNPTQARRLGELLTLAGEELENCDRIDRHFGGIQVELEFDDYISTPF